MNNIPWNVLTKTLDEVDYYVPKLADVRLIVRIISFAAIERDDEFFGSWEFIAYCLAIRCCPLEVRTSLAWE